MPLDGTIDSFGISEILQLVSHQGKTGTLEIETTEGIAKLRFRDGKLAEAWPDRRSPAELIGSLLVRAGLISPVQLDHALNRQRQSLRRIGDILIRMGALRTSEFQEILALQHRETVYWLLRLKRGRFRFRPEAVEFEEGISSSLDVGALLMEGFRQIDEWPQLLERIPSDRQVFSRRPEQEVPSDLGPQEARALALVNGVSTVREIVDRLRLGDFEGRAALVDLSERGLISPLRLAPRPVLRKRQKLTTARRLPDAMLAFALLGLALLLIGFAITTGRGVTRDLRAGLGEIRSQARASARRAELWRKAEPPTWPAAGDKRRPGG